MCVMVPKDCVDTASPCSTRLSPKSVTCVTGWGREEQSKARQCPSRGMQVHRARKYACTARRCGPNRLRLHPKQTQ